MIYLSRNVIFNNKNSETYKVFLEETDIKGKIKQLKKGGMSYGNKIIGYGFRYGYRFYGKRAGF